MGDGTLEPVIVATAHALLIGPAVERLRDAEIDMIVTNDSVTPPPNDLDIVTVSLGGQLAEVVHRLHEGRPRDELAAHR